ncbi:MAG: AI-2E family transporter [Candidatus Aenigmarchaeota archaeon]|nr:AI-2E family transporter [Candidatus Aenigmarchaeota archaeon]NCS71072.1 AI-2E family transporter [Candidatus Aenigmarchaeota archaeon]PIV68209.1 MAG: hypothetical protein COS07_04800 [Candidatus Aenigmarchaeota archaeon CG01_land_8_20_14_3_00_37_9]PIW41550.1 MAG: hypothetical protein COW21_01490 [Candidatus Aenigmarchaeota archaeon CG15_BIG_FIL_POST_REV_8_21_14_020_37_27]PIX51095.1 MAG: hypothetical protein COZ52_00840 [Candidatus Aenigmarchaeota archaeon CG_4_8_14_3_um_filter_37_24]
MIKEKELFSLAFLLIILYLSFLLFKPFLSSLIFAMIISYSLYPIYKKVNSKVKNENLSIILVLFVGILLVLGPIALITYSLIDDISNFIWFLRNLDINSMPFITPELAPIVNNYMIKLSESIGLNLLNLISRIIPEITNRLFNVLVFLFVVYMFLKNGPDLIKKFKVTIPIEKTQKEALINEFSSVTKGMIYSMLISSILSGLIGGLIFYLFGIPNAFLWGFLMMILSFIPIIGNFPVWLGGAIHLIIFGDYLIGALLLVLYMVTNQLENMLAMKAVGNKFQINFFLIFIGIVSGLKVFGPIGIIVGPLILTILITLIRFYTKDYKEEINLE